MRVRCIAEEPTPSQSLRLGAKYRAGRTVFLVRAGREYLVLGLGVWEGVEWIEIETPTEDIISVPLFLFQIVDGSVSSHWEVRLHEDGAITMWPKLFYENFFRSDLSNDVPAVLERYRILKRQILEEGGWALS